MYNHIVGNKKILTSPVTLFVPDLCELVAKVDSIFSGFIASGFLFNLIMACCNSFILISTKVKLHPALLHPRVREFHPHFACILDLKSLYLDIYLKSLSLDIWYKSLSLDIYFKSLSLDRKVYCSTCHMTWFVHFYFVKHTLSVKVWFDRPTDNRGKLLFLKFHKPQQNLSQKTWNFLKFEYVRAEVKCLPFSVLGCQSTNWNIINTVGPRLIGPIGTEDSHLYLRFTFKER